MHTVFALLCFVVVIHWLIFPYPSGLLHRHWGNLTIAPVPAKQPWWIWINTSCEFIMNDYITTTKQSTTKPCAYFLGCTVVHYDDVIMTTIASQITSLTVVYSIVYSDADERKHQSSASLAFVWGIHRDRWIPRTKGQLRGKCFHLMTSSCWYWTSNQWWPSLLMHTSFTNPMLKKSRKVKSPKGMTLLDLVSLFFVVFIVICRGRFSCWIFVC